MLERKRRMEDKFKNDMDRRQAQIDQQAELLIRLKEQQEERLNRQIEQAAAESENREMEKREKREREWQAIVDSRSRQLQNKDARKQRAAAEEASFRQHRIITTDIMRQEDEKSQQERREANKKLLDFHHMQREDKTLKTKAEKVQDRLEGQMMKQALEEEEEMFSRYVNTVMTEYSAKGRDVSLMRPVKRRGDTI